MENLVRNIKRAFAGWMLILFVGYIGGVTLFQHTHIINGQVVAHSHPYSDKGTHSHTNAQLAILAHLSLIVMLAAVFGYLAAIFASARKISGAPATVSYTSGGIFRPALRGPPSLT